MTLLAPLALVFLAAVPIIILFYILRAQYERVPVPSTLLWRNVVRDTEGRPTWRPPIKNILLFLQILAALLGAFALSRPATLGQTAHNRIYILDASSSMQATLPVARRRRPPPIRRLAVSDQVGSWPTARARSTSPGSWRSSASTAAGVAS